MTIEYAVRALVMADATLTSLISTRFYPVPLPENKPYPTITYQQISEVQYSSHNDADPTYRASGPGLAETRLQLNVWADTYDSARTVRDNLKRVLRDFRGSAGSPAIRIDRIQWANDLSLPDPDTQKQRRVIDLLIWHGTTY